MQILRFSATNFRIRFRNINLSFTYTWYLSVVVRNNITPRFCFKSSSAQSTWETSIFRSFNNFLSLVFLWQLKIRCIELFLQSLLHLIIAKLTVTVLFYNYYYTIFSPLVIKIKLIEENRIFTTCPLRMNSWKKIFRKIDFSVTLNNLHFQFLCGSFCKHRSKKDAEFCYTLWIWCC